MYQIPSLKYKYSDLEPYIDKETMRIHHTKHHQAYVDKLNATLEKYPDLAQKPLEELLADLQAVPEDIRMAVQNHGGGHWNHSFFWDSLQAPAGEKLSQPKEKMIDLIDASFGNLEELQKKFKEVAMAHFGSGWAWLTLAAGKLEIVSTGNQDTPISEGPSTPLGTHVKPLLALDVWEHAYYLKYQNRRADYLDAFWQVLNWERVEELVENGSR